MALYVGNGKKLKVNLGGKVYKVMDSITDLIKYYVAAIKAGTKTIEDVPADLRAGVEASLN